MLQPQWEKAIVVDIDGSFVYCKHKQLAEAGLQVAPLPLPSPPLTVSQENVFKRAKRKCPM